MIRLLLTTTLLLSFAPARAQQEDSVTRRRAPLFVAALPDSIAPFPRAAAVYTAVAPASGPLPVLLYPSLQPALGRVAGVQVTSFSGAPGTNTALRIRGIASILGPTQPLILLDGMPVYTSGAPGSVFLLNGRAAQPNFTNTIILRVDPPEDTNMLLGIAPEDIDSVELVKSAFGTARYGSLGANGVVHIRTRRGAGSRPAQLTYSGYGGMQHVARRYALLGAREYADLANEINVKRGGAPVYPAAQLEEFSRTGGTNWQDEVLQTATTQSHHVGLRGRGAHTAYAASAGYLRQNGVVLNSHLARYAFRLNVDQHITPRLQVSGRAALTRTNRRRPDEDHRNSIFDALLASPTLPVRDAAGRFTNEWGFPGPSFYNPVQELLESYHDLRTQQALLQLTAHYQLAPGVRATLAAGHERNKLEGEGYSNEMLGPSYSPKIRAYETNATHQNTFLAAGLALNRAFADHLLTASLGYERLGVKLAESRIYSPSADGGLQAQAATPISSGTAMASYTFRRRYALEASLRADHTPSNDARWFPGAQLTWHLGQEAWAPTPWVGDAHFWVGTGRTGNRGFIKPRADNFSGVIFSGVSGVYNPAAYEQTWQYEAGWRSAWRAGRLTAALVAYRRRSSDLEMTTYYSSPIGPAPTSVFVGEVRNQGVEATISAGWHLGPLQATTAVAAATNANRVEKIPENTSFYRVDRQRVVVGQPLGAFYGYEQNGTFPVGHPQAGRRRYDALAQPDGGEETYLGSSGLPRHSLNVLQTLAWHRWHLDLQADGLFGYRVLNYQSQTLDNPSSIYNATTRIRQRWTPANPNTDVPAAGLGDPLFSQRVLENGNHLRLTQLTLTVDVVQMPRARVSVWAGGTNLLLLTRYRGFDPNVSSAQLESARPGVDYGAYPTARTLLVGIRATL